MPGDTYATMNALTEIPVIGPAVRYVDSKKDGKPQGESVDYLIALAEDSGIALPENFKAKAMTEHGRARKEAKVTEGMKKGGWDIPTKKLTEFPNAWLAYRLERLAEELVNAHKASNSAK